MAADPRRRARARTEQVLEMLDQATQHAQEPTQYHDPFMGLHDNPEQCWRCLRVPAAGELGVCDPCLTALRSEEMTAPAEDATSMGEMLRSFIDRALNDTELAPVTVHYSPPWASPPRDGWAAPDPHMRPPFNWGGEIGHFGGLPIDAWTSPVLGVGVWSASGGWRVLRPPMLRDRYLRWGRCTVADRELPIGQHLNAACDVRTHRHGTIIEVGVVDGTGEIGTTAQMFMPADPRFTMISTPVGIDHNWFRSRFEEVDPFDGIGIRRPRVTQEHLHERGLVDGDLSPVGERSSVADDLAAALSAISADLAERHSLSLEEAAERIGREVRAAAMVELMVRRWLAHPRRVSDVGPS